MSSFQLKLTAFFLALAGITLHETSIASPTGCPELKAALSAHPSMQTVDAPGSQEAPANRSTVTFVDSRGITVAARSRAVAGRAFTEQDFAALLPLANAAIKVYPSTTSAHELGITITHPAFVHELFRKSMALLTISKNPDNENEVVLNTSYFRFAAHVTEAQKAVIFFDIMNWLRIIGIPAARLTGFGDDSQYNPNDHGRGASAENAMFARLGGNVHWSEQYRQYIERGLGRQNLVDMQAIVNAPGGLDWWRRNGDNIPLRFSTDPNAGSFAALRRHLESLGVSTPEQMMQIRSEVAALPQRR